MTYELFERIFKEHNIEIVKDADVGVCMRCCIRRRNVTCDIRGICLTMVGSDGRMMHRTHGSDRMLTKEDSDRATEAILTMINMENVHV